MVTSEPRTFETLDETFLRIGKGLPGFGGLYFDEQGNLVVTIKPTLAKGARPSNDEIKQGIAVVLGNDFLTQPISRSDGKIVTPQLVVYKAQFSFAELASYAKPLQEIMSKKGTVFFDIDETKNRIVIGVEKGFSNSFKQQVLDLSVPDTAIVFEITEPIVPSATLRDTLSPIPGGVQIGTSQYYCTLGFNLCGWNSPRLCLEKAGEQRKMSCESLPAQKPQREGAAVSHGVSGEIPKGSVYGRSQPRTQGNLPRNR
jgi:hypothetical protein